MIRRFSIWMAVLGILSTVLGCGDDQITHTLLDEEKDFYASAPEMAGFRTTGRVMVRVFYVEPDDHTRPAGYKNKIRRVVVETRRFFADQMEQHEHGRKTFDVHRNDERRISVTPITLDENAEFYENMKFGELTEHIAWKTWEEPYADEFPINGEWRTNVFVIALPYERMNACKAQRVCRPTRGLARGGKHQHQGSAWVLDRSLNKNLLAHELGHTTGLEHDFSDDSFVMSYVNNHSKKLSRESAKWLDRSRAFNHRREQIIDAPVVGDMRASSTMLTVTLLPNSDRQSAFYDYGVLLNLNGYGDYPEVIGYSTSVRRVRRDIYIVRITSAIPKDVRNVELRLIGSDSNILYHSPE